MTSQSTDIDRIRMFFEPKSLAIVGVSRTPGKFGNIILENLLNLGYDGKVFPVNPNMREISGVRCYPSLPEIPDVIDLVVIAVPAQATPPIMSDCEKKGVKGVVIIGSGFGEAGEEGARLQQEVVDIARRAGIRVVGPNTTGILNPYQNFTTTFLDTKGVKKGSIAFISQTGIFAGMMMEWIVSSQNFGFSKVAGLGNKCDVADHEILDYLGQDEATKVIIMYIEGIRDGKRFLQSTQQLTKKKPLIVLKAGRTKEGAKAAFSHTGSLAGNDVVFDALFRQSGIIRANGFEELLDFAKMFAFQPVPPGSRMGIVSFSGGAAVLAADLCIESGLVLANVQGETLQKVQDQMPSWAKASHPLDIEPLTETIGAQDAYKMSLEAVLADEGVDCCLFVMGVPPQEEIQADFLADVKQNHPEKPLAVCIIARKEIYERWFHDVEEARIPVFFGVRRAVNSLAALCKYRQFISE